MHRIAVLVPLLVLTGCVTPPNRPPFAYESAEGVVYGDALDAAREVARKAAPISEQVRGVIGTDGTDPWELWLLEEQPPWLPALDGSGHLAEWVVRAGPMRWRGSFLMLHGEKACSDTYVLAHEIAHWHTRTWDVPRVLLEGAADWVAARVAVEAAPALAEHASVALAMLRDGYPVLADLAPLDLTEEGWNAVTREDEVLLYAYGCAITDQLGLDGLQRLSGAPRDTLREAVATALERALQNAPERAAGPNHDAALRADQRTRDSSSTQRR